VRISELIEQLEALRRNEGDLDVIHRQGEMDDPYGVAEVKAVNVNRSQYGVSVYYDFPWDESTVTNARAVELA
jgi:hypothetical protein